jgi:hypothetical protein
MRLDQASCTFDLVVQFQKEATLRIVLLMVKFIARLVRCQEMRAMLLMCQKCCRDYLLINLIPCLRIISLWIVNGFHVLALSGGVPP